MPSARVHALAGAFGGVLGGTAMTVLITQVAPRVAPASMLPSTPAPLKALQWTERAVSEPDALSSPQEKGAALAGHAVFSAVGGAVYALARRQPPLAALPTPVAGVLFGLVLWVGSFEVALPALGVMPRTTQHPPKRWPAPLLGHAIFGVVTAFVTESATRRLDR